MDFSDGSSISEPSILKNSGSKYVPSDLDEGKLTNVLNTVFDSKKLLRLRHTL